MLTLPQAVLLLATGERGRDALAGGSQLAPQLAASALLELALQGKVLLRECAVVVRDPLSTGSFSADEALAAICEASGQASPAEWVPELVHHSPHLPDLVAQELVNLGFAHLREGRILRAYPRRLEAPTDPTGEVAVLKAIRRAAAAGTADERAACAACALRLANLSHLVFPFSAVPVADTDVEKVMHACARAAPWVQGAIAGVTLLGEEPALNYALPRVLQHWPK